MTNHCPPTPSRCENRKPLPVATISQVSTMVVAVPCRPGQRPGPLRHLGRLIVLLGRSPKLGFGHKWITLADQVTGRRCYKNSLRIKKGDWEELAEDQPQRVFFAELDSRGELRDDRRPQPSEELKDI
ncbi:hypothetical protein SESBI_39767 [Sesbania bispinosa]|nr:hypothetical protein SESBI_39767 [Sesbania bispinosa]